MEEIVKLSLENEMDLILAHKRTMKLAELCGLGIPAQTTFATAVSEIARCAISSGKKSMLVLGINSRSAGKKEIRASVFDLVDLGKENPEAFSYARRLMGQLEIVKTGNMFEVRLNHLINFSGTMSETKIQLLKDHFRNEPPISPYDEIRKRNIQLIELSNKLRESEKQYQMLTDTLPLMMFAINAKGEVTYSNKWLKDFFAEQSQQVSSVSWQSMLHPEDIKEIWRSWDKSQLERTAFKAQARLKNKSEKYVWHLITIVPVINEKNIAASWIGFFVDIHSQKLVEETLKDNKDLKEVQKALEEYQLKLEQTISELKVSNQNLEQFAFIASHDLQEPLRKIKTFANLLESDLQLNEKQNGYFRKIKDSSDRMSNLIRDVLNYSRLSNLEDAFEDTDLNTLMNTVLLDFELLIGEKEAKVTVSRLPTLRVMPLQINQLFSNLLHNALKFSNEKPVVEISSYLLSEQEKSKRPELDAAKNYHCIRFRDNGIGFDPEYSEKIFRIFQRLEESNAGGTGIGLALCRRIMENHKGFITAESPGEGAVFNLVFPSVTEA